MTFPRIIAEFSSDALIGNYRAIRAQVPELMLLPMVKANAYGHGVEWVVRQLQGLEGLTGFGVATLEEGQEVRRALGPRYRNTRVLVFSGSSPWTEEKGQFCEKYNLAPVIASDSDWHRFSRGGWFSRISYELKFDTGMSRLGIGLGLVRSIVKVLSAKPPVCHPAGICTHLAMSEDSDARISRLQLERFSSLKAETASAFSAAQFHMANSGAIWNSKKWRLRELTDFVRPGISLYGAPPWAGAPLRGLIPVMTLKALILIVRRLRPGESLGYGATFRVKGRDSVSVAILAGGYADGIKRSLSNSGQAWLGGRAQRFLGIVSMDLSAVSCPSATRAGDWAEILGPHVDIWAQSKAAQTIPYELLTSIAQRVERMYAR